MLPPTVATHFFRWIPVASYDNSQSDIDVMFEYKYVSIPTGISFWPTNILQKFVYIFRPYLVPPIVLYLRHVTPSIMPKVHGGHIVVWGDVQRVWHICYCGGNNAGVSWSLHNVLFGQYVFLPTKQAETCLQIQIYVLIYHSTHICPSLFCWKENLIFMETVISKLQIWDFRVILTNFECSHNNVSSAGKWKVKQVFKFSS